MHDCLALALALAASCVPSGRARITEVFYDAVGDDSGREYVELWNPHPFAVQLEGTRLESGDGSGAGRWTARWTAAATDTIAPGARFVVGGALVTPAPHAAATLDLQNGPDAVRLVWPDGAVEVVGWGSHEIAEYACGSPAPDVASGRALARLPDDADFGANALDFADADPTPGSPNRPARDAAVAIGSLALDPPFPAAHATLAVACTLVNRGVEPIPPGVLEVEIAAEQAGVREPLARSTPAAAIAAGERRALGAVVQAPAAGRWRFEARVRLAGDGVPANDADTLRVRVGTPPLTLSEVQFHPADGGGEWIEVRNASAEPLALERFALGDRGATRATPSAGPLLAPDSLALLCQDRAALLARHPGLDSTRVRVAAPWPALNNSDDDRGVADVITLYEDDGTPCERLAYSAAGVPAGTPIERRDGAWWPAFVTDGTPLAPPRALSSPVGGLELAPRRLRAGGVTTVTWSLPWERARLAAELYDLSGRRVAALWPETPMPGRGERAWSSGALPPGLYVVLVRARSERGEVRSLRRALRVLEGGR